MSPSIPTAYILAGPNGAGKTSLYWYEASAVPRLNGDTLYQQGYDTYAVEAALRQQLDRWVEQKASFVIETNAASQRDYDLFVSLKKAGYRLELRYVGLESVALCQQRVIQRVIEGGHDVPPALVQHRYDSGLSLLKRHYRTFDQLQFYDNTGEQAQLLVSFLAATVPSTTNILPNWLGPVIQHITKMEKIYQRLSK